MITIAMLLFLCPSWHFFWRKWTATQCFSSQKKSEVRKSGCPHTESDFGFLGEKSPTRARSEKVDVHTRKAILVSWVKKPKLGDESENISLHENVNNEQDRCSDQAYMGVAGET
jgi:hypothetical protein